MHRHAEAGTARGCSRFCQANVADREYHRLHHHYADEAPAKGCLACEELKRRMGDKRKQQETLLRGQGR